MWRGDVDGLSRVVNSLAARERIGNKEIKLQDDLFAAVLSGVRRLHEHLDRNNGIDSHRPSGALRRVAQGARVDQAFILRAHRLIAMGNALRHIKVNSAETLIESFACLLDAGHSHGSEESDSVCSHSGPEHVAHHALALAELAVRGVGMLPHSSDRCCRQERAAFPPRRGRRRPRPRRLRCGRFGSDLFFGSDFEPVAVLAGISPGGAS